MKLAIRTEELSKLYRLGVITSRTVAQDFSRFMAKIRGRPDPFRKIGAINDRKTADDKSFVWALKDVSLDINKGDIVGIIGRNGAGKSTLLKILSRVTAPTTGIVKINGRIASLLEVGTGFHQELTGRENIFLNGSILGMTRSEIRKKFDEIVEFSGVGNYVDTPVKRYSSGMYVRLAFAVAAHLEPDILIIDEVLAVGDAEFQKKCIGKMQDVSRNEGRTVLFVSHNMGAVNNLCNSAILMENGKVRLSGSTSDVVSAYLSPVSSANNEAEFTDSESDAYLKRIFATQKNSEGTGGDMNVKYPLTLTFEFAIRNFIKGMSIAFSVYSGSGTKVFYSSSRIDELLTEDSHRTGSFSADVEIPGMFLAPGNYYINASMQIENVQLFDFRENALSFTIAESGSTLSRFKGRDVGVVLAELNWKSNGRLI